MATTHHLVAVPPPPGARLPNSAELLCRYVLGLRRPDMAYLEAVMAYLDRAYWPGIGASMLARLGDLDPTSPLTRAGGRAERRVTVWSLTGRGAGEAERILSEATPHVRHRRPARRALVAMATMGAFEAGVRTASLRAAFAEASLARLRMPACRGGPRTTAEVIAAASGIGEVFAAASPVASRLRLDDDEVPAVHCLAQLAKQGLLRRGSRTAEVPPPVLTVRRVATLQAMARDGSFKLSPLATAILSRRVDRRRSAAAALEATKDARSLHAILASHLRHTTSEVHAVAEQVVLRCPVNVFDPRSALRDATARSAAEALTTRRVDLVVWRPQDDAGFPSLLVELEGPHTGGRTHLRVKNHLEAAMTVSAKGARRVELCFVAHSAVRRRVEVAAMAFADRLRGGATGLWRDADVAVRVLPLGRVRQDGLESGADTDVLVLEIHGRRGAATAGTSPLALLGEERLSA